jgi:hypothetical protein
LGLVFACYKAAGDEISYERVIHILRATVQLQLRSKNRSPHVHHKPG